jgi:hypothetical protein
MPSAGINLTYNFWSVRSLRQPQLEGHHAGDHTRTDPEDCHRVYGGKNNFLLQARSDCLRPLADQPASLEELAGQTAVPARDNSYRTPAMVSLGLIDREVGRYRNGELSCLPCCDDIQVCAARCLSYRELAPSHGSDCRRSRKEVASISSRAICSRRHFQPIMMFCLLLI